MTPRIIAALALSLSLGTAALAQTSTTGTDTSSGAATGATTTLPTGWEGDIANAFFSDPTAGTLKSDEEIKTGFEGLSAEQQAQVKTDCENQMAASGTGTTTEETAATDTQMDSGAATDSSDQAASADTSGASDSSDDLQTGSTSTDTMASSGTDTSGAASATGSGDMMASLNQLCSVIQGM